MIRLYFKQAWNLFRQERLFSLVYVLGTGLSITMVMVLSIIFYLKIANVYPETNRDRMLLVRSSDLTWGQGAYSGGLSEKTIEKCFIGLKNVEAVGVDCNSYTDYEVQPEGNNEQWPVVVKPVNTDFWKVFPFRFVEGKAFTEADFQSALPVAVISRSLARRLFGEENAVGREVSLNFIRHRVRGVVEDASLITERTYASLWIPYTLCVEYKDGEKWAGLVGRLHASLLVKPGIPLESVQEEVSERVRRLSLTLGEGNSFSLHGQPDRQWQSVIRLGSNTDTDYLKLLLQYGFIFLVLLLVPAVSLSGMADSRMERRLAEMGVRRAFGAPSKTLMGQVLTENLLFTVLGGVFGLLLSYLLIFVARDWVMHILRSGFIDLPPEGTEVVVSAGMLMNYVVFGVALLVCFLLNLLSSLIPAWKASRREITYSLNAK